MTRATAESASDGDSLRGIEWSNEKVMHLENQPSLEISAL